MNRDRPSLTVVDRVVRCAQTDMPVSACTCSICKMHKKLVRSEQAMRAARQRLLTLGDDSLEQQFVISQLDAALGDVE